ncbi:InlB B-repeat-containing protein, partial [Bifidobacterium platyrrhinorum]|uniref:InlB B-repeat-containing protein n=1 Tax=Bifidobacterium platyrrhinorum TaxID=2661628 RepID=UPI0013D0B98C
MTLKKIIAGATAIAALAVLAPMTAQAAENAPAAAATTSETTAKLATVHFMSADGTLIQDVAYNAGTQTFATYTAGIQAPAVEGKVFAGWAFASNEGDKLVDPTQTVSGDIYVYATYKDVPAAKDATVSFYGADQ